MPAFNFKKQFAPLVKSKQKRQTIRAKRKDGRNPRVGSTLYLKVGMRAKGCRSLGEATCKSVDQITIYETGVVINGCWLTPSQEAQFAQDDGFPGAYEMFSFFQKQYGLPFEGLLYKW